jgi:hypothetical protein
MKAFRFLFVSTNLAATASQALRLTAKTPSKNRSRHGSVEVCLFEPKVRFHTAKQLKLENKGKER